MRQRVLLSITFATLAACKPAREAAPPPPAQKLAFYATPYQKKPPHEALVALGRKLFADPLLSASGTLACATCHDPARAYGPPADLAVALGGMRAVPSLRYLTTVRPFTEHYQDDDEGGADQGPAGGFTWDGRVQSTHDQARFPLFSLAEMANASPEALVARLRAAPVGGAVREAFGEKVLDSPGIGMRAVLLALEVFQESPPDFRPYDSKYDAFLLGKVELDPSEARGLAAFNDPKRGNCAVCHPSRIKRGSFPLFTDFGFVAIGVPRNRDLPAGRSDLGLCGPLRADLSAHPEYCGLFRVPSLRNVALRRRYMHNGVFTRLEDVVRFYAERDLHPEKWYPRRPDGTVDTYDDLPPRYQDNVNREPPFDRHPGDRPALSETDIADVVAFLGTLTDGYRP